MGKDQTYFLVHVDNMDGDFYTESELIEAVRIAVENGAREITIHKEME